MIASELLMLNISKVGRMLTRSIRNVRVTLKSSWLMRSMNDELYGSSGIASVVWDIAVVGAMICPAGHGAGHVDGYRVVPRVNVMFRLVATVVPTGSRCSGTRPTP